MQTNPSAFSRTYDSIQNKLINESWVKFQDKSYEAKTLWDTGATCSCISHEVVNALGLTPTGIAPIQTPLGETTVNTYLVDIELPNKVPVKDVRVFETEIGKQGLGLLIGMDIINQGDFSVSNFNGKTTFTFCIPSLKTLDYAKQIIARNVIGAKHGSGKRKR